MNDFEKVWNFESLYRAYMKARRGKRWKGAAAKFEVNLLEALNLLSEQLKSKTYRLSPYNTFKVYEPKERVVMSNSYKDKVVQHALCDNVLQPRVAPSFIKDNYASQVGKGTHFGLALNEKTNIYPLKNGIDFLGFHTYISETGAVIRKVRRKSKNNVRRKLKKMRGLLEAGRITPETVEQSYKS